MEPVCINIARGKRNIQQLASVVDQMQFEAEKPASSYLAQPDQQRLKAS
jgi:hypothetical protein